MRKLPIIIGIIAAAAIVGGVLLTFLSGGTGENAEVYVDYIQDNNLSSNEYTIMLNDEMLDERAFKEDGHIYVSQGLANKLFNRFYYDESTEALLYTTTNETRQYKLDDSAYYVDGNKTAIDYPIFKTVNGVKSLSLDYLKENGARMECNIYDDTQRVVIRNYWGEAEIMSVTEDTFLRYKGEANAKIVTAVKKGDVLTVKVSDAHFDGWTRVISPDGRIGFVNNKCTSEASVITRERPEIQDIQFNHILRDKRILLSWHQVMSEAAASTIDTVLNNTQGINVLAPTWMSFADNNGNVRFIGTQDYVNKAHAQGKEIWVVFSNEIDGVFSGERVNEILKDSGRRAQVVQQAVAAVKSVGAEGINLDFEAVPAETISITIQFIRELAVECEKNGLVLSMDMYVPKYTYYYDRQELANYLDYICIMGYDEHTYGSAEAGATASIGFVEQGITDTLKEVPANQVINGMPFYTPIWVSNPDGPAIEGFYDMATAYEIAAKHNAQITYIEALGVNYAAYTSEVNDLEYQIWFSDAKLIGNLMTLAGKYNLAGVATWKLGLESADVWPVIVNGLNY